MFPCIGINNGSHVVQSGEDARHGCYLCADGCPRTLCRCDTSELSSLGVTIAVPRVHSTIANLLGFCPAGGKLSDASSGLYVVGHTKVATVTDGSPITPSGGRAMRMLGWSYVNVDSCDVLPHLKQALKALEVVRPGCVRNCPRIEKLRKVRGEGQAASHRSFKHTGSRATCSNQFRLDSGMAPSIPL